MSLLTLFGLIFNCFSAVLFTRRHTSRSFFNWKNWKKQLVGEGIQNLDASLIPTSANNRRLILIGDVHGCLEELKLLLEKCKFDPVTDHAIFVGDIVAKGPFSLETISFIDDMEHSASCVRGNHDVKLMLWNAYLKSETIDEDNIAEERLPDGLTRRDEHRFLAKNLDADQVAYLDSLPYIIRIDMPHQEYLVVHAGLLPGKTLAKQRTWDVCNMRNIKGKKALEDRESGGVGWFEKWENAQRKLSKKRRQVVIYGHDAGRGLNLREFTKGLDSRCVRGGALTAMIITSKGESYVHVNCKRRYD